MKVGLYACEKSDIARFPTTKQEIKYDLIAIKIYGCVSQ